MTNSTTSGYPGSGDASLGGRTPAGAATGTTTPGAREEAANLASDAGDAGRRVAGVAKDETRAVGSEARRQARRLADQVGGEVRQQAAHQQQRAANGLRGLGDEFSKMAAGEGSGSGIAADIARQTGDRVGAAAQWIGERDPKAVLGEVKGFARRRPGVFLAIAVGAGIVVGRLVRALAQPSDEDAGRSDLAGTSGSRMGTGSGAISDSALGTAGTAGVSGGTGAAAATAGVPGVTGSETVVTGTAGETSVDPLTGESWAEGDPSTSRGGIR
jgi:hypothetical protein